MFRVLTNNANYAFTFDHFAFIANLLNRWSYFHRIPRVKGLVIIIINFLCLALNVKEIHKPFTGPVYSTLGQTAYFCYRANALRI